MPPVRVLQTSGALEAYKVINFRACGISRDARKLTRTPTLIKNFIKNKSLQEYNKTTTEISDEVYLIANTSNFNGRIIYLFIHKMANLETKILSLLILYCFLSSFSNCFRLMMENLIIT
jgi:hypothetical protein